jgi:ATP-dependent DNA helicase RecG
MANLETIKGIGPKLKKELNQMGIKDCFDLIKYYPARYEQFHIVSFSNAPDHTRVTLEATCTDYGKVHYIRKNLNKVTFNVIVEDHSLKVSIFNRAYIKNILSPNVDIVMTGTLDRLKHTFTATTLKLKRNFTNEIQPIYNIEKIGNQRFQKLALQAVEQYGYMINDVIPAPYLKAYKLLPLDELIQTIHMPKNNQDLIQINRRMKYEEALLFQLQMQYRRLKNKRQKSVPKAYHLDKIKQFIKTLPFELTPGQKKATNEIIKDIKSPFVMNRLLQGDVGSGKTVVAAISIVTVLHANQQVALMAPTEILAKQHYKTFKTYLEPLPFEVVLLHGKLSKEERLKALDVIRMNDACLIIGTHALFSDDVSYNHLGYVITDEQHRFGVAQRKKLREKGILPDVLYMTATPIPRTMAISVFGDMDITTIVGKPHNHAPVETTLFKHKNIDLVYKVMNEELKEGHQIYVVTPLIVESQSLNVTNAQQVYKELKETFQDYSVGLLHSKVNDDDKEEVMHLFEQKKINILVSTTVIEVGINVLNATMMVILNAERFGLSQLHQLRGRVGRGAFKGYCLMVYDETVDDIERLNILEETNNGFILSEEDLKRRGPGEFFGVRQSGLPTFNHIDLIEDSKILSIAKTDSIQILNDQSTYTNPVYQPLYKALKKALKQVKFD